MVFFISVLASDNTTILNPPPLTPTIKAEGERNIIRNNDKEKCRGKSETNWGYIAFQLQKEIVCVGSCLIE